MEKSIIIRYAEIHLKGRNIKFFINMLFKNLRNAVKDMDCRVQQGRCRFVIDNYDEMDEFEIMERVSKVFGVHSISSAYIVKSDMETIRETVLKCIDFEGSFKVETNRADKRIEMTSPQISAYLGGEILDAFPNLTVNVRNPDHIVNVDIRENGKAYIFEKIVKCVGGLPTGCSGNAVIMLSGGIDSPVAAYMMAKRGLKLEGIYFHSYPYTGDLAKQKVADLAKIINSYTGNFVLNVVPFTKIQEAIHEKCDEELMITLMRRIMMRISEKMAVAQNAKAIITGESLGQVASQTIESINITNEVVEMPVLRPLIGFDKIEIIEIAKKIGTMETSILPYEDCCTVFLPKNPVIKPRHDVVVKAEEALDIETLVDEAIAGVEKITF